MRLTGQAHMTWKGASVASLVVFTARAARLTSETISNGAMVSE